MSRCRATKKDGSPCTLPAVSAEGLCWAHDPANAELRRMGQSRGGRSKPSRELADLKRRLMDLADDVLEGRADRGDAAVVSQIYNTVIRAISLELAVRDQLELVQRMEALEDAITANKEAKRWHG